MSSHIEKFIKVLAELCKEKGLKATVSGSVKGGLVTGCSALVGGLLLGPAGLALGGIVGGGISALKLSNSFESVAVVLYKMNPQQQEMLYNNVKRAFRNVGVQDVMTLSAVLMSSKSLQELAIKELALFMSKELQLSVTV